VTEVPTVLPSVLQIELRQVNAPFVLDLRNENEFTGGHIDSAARVNVSELANRVRELPKDQPIVLVCEHGNLAALSVPLVRGTGHKNLKVLAGGMEAWLRDGRAVTRERKTPPVASSFPQLKPTKFEAILAYGAGVVIKPVYMLMSLGIILWLRRSEYRELKLLRAGLMAFLAGEAACLVGFYFDPKSVIFHGLDALHGFGMAVGMAYGFWGVYEIIERRILSMNDFERGCAMSRFCATCTRQKDTLCLPQQHLRHGIWLLLPLVVFPWTSPLVVHNGTTLLFGTQVDYCWPVINQILEIRIYPFVALIAFVIAWFLLHGPRRYLELSHRFLFLGVGLFTFSMLRFVLKSTFAEAPYWGDIWEEVTELQGVAILWFVLWVFRKRFGLSTQ
jgi:rhodanese-related sulfurtransferase